MNKEELLKAVDEFQNEYDASLEMNRYSWNEDNSHAKQFKLLEDAELKGHLVNSAINWIHDSYDYHECHDCCYCWCENENNPFNYLRGVINNEINS